MMKAENIGNWNSAASLLKTDEEISKLIVKFAEYSMLTRGAQENVKTKNVEGR